MKKILCLALSLAGFSGYSQTFNSVGSATTISGGYNLTPCTTSGPAFQIGGIWSHSKLNFNWPFTLTFDASFDVVWGMGGDGIGVIFKKDSGTSTLNMQRTGHRIAYYRDLAATPADSLFLPFDTSSFIVEFDTYPNTVAYGDDPSDRDHTAIAKNGTFTPVSGGGPVPILASGASVKDNTFRNYTVKWTPPNTITVKEGANVRLITTINPITIFGGSTTVSPAVTWGILGTTGSHYSNNIIKNVSMVVDSPLSAPLFTGGKAITLSVVPNPNEGTFSLSGYVAEGADVKVEVVNLIGKVVYSDNVPVGKYGLHTTVTLPPAIANGLYIIRVSNSNLYEVARFSLKR